MFGILSRKQCGACQKWKDKSEFHKHKGHKDGLDSRCKSCSNSDHRDLYSANPEKYRERDKAWVLANPEKSRSRHQGESYLGKVREYSRKWRVTHPDKANENSRNRRARKNGNGGRITADEWEALKAKHGHTCLRCKRREPEIKLVLDHVVPLALKGENVIENAQPLCVSCNCRKAKKVADYR